MLVLKTLSHKNVQSTFLLKTKTSKLIIQLAKRDSLDYRLTFYLFLKDVNRHYSL